jgi:CheY-like chemotaxis protein
MNTCRSVSKMLRSIEMRPDWTSSGKEAVVRAQDAMEMDDEYKVYIIDYLMPDMNGIETVRRIRKVISEDVPIIVLTAYDWDEFEHEAREAGVTAFVSKPIFMSELRDVLTRPVVSEKVVKEEKAQSYDYSDKRVLLVEDNELNREIAVAILEETGMTVDCAEDGDVAVATINREPAGKYDLILMDVQMPRMDGYTATREIRTLADNRKANIPIVAMTANAFEEDRKRAYESGMNGHIIKPISIEAIAKVLDAIFAEKIK